MQPGRPTHTNHYEQGGIVPPLAAFEAVRDNPDNPKTEAPVGLFRTPRRA